MLGMLGSRVGRVRALGNPHLASLRKRWHTLHFAPMVETNDVAKTYIDKT